MYPTAAFHNRAVCPGQEHSLYVTFDTCLHTLHGQPVSTQGSAAQQTETDPEQIIYLTSEQVSIIEETRKLRRETKGLD